MKDRRSEHHMNKGTGGRPTTRAQGTCGTAGKGGGEKKGNNVSRCTVAPTSPALHSPASI